VKFATNIRHASTECALLRRFSGLEIKDQGHMYRCVCAMMTDAFILTGGVNAHLSLYKTG